MTQKGTPPEKKRSAAILWTALLLGLAMPFGVYFALQNGLMAMTIMCFCLLALAMALTAWKG